MKRLAGLDGEGASGSTRTRVKLPINSVVKETEGSCCRQVSAQEDLNLVLYCLLSLAGLPGLLAYRDRVEIQLISQGKCSTIIRHIQLRLIAVADGCQGDDPVGLQQCVGRGGRRLPLCGRTE